MTILSGYAGSVESSPARHFPFCLLSRSTSPLGGFVSIRNFCRRFLRRSVKPLAMAAVAGGVALSLVITTPSNAQAFVPVPILPAVYGATTMAIPELMATSAILGPVGWTIAGVAVVGLGLYATKDYWLPYVTGAWGQDANNKPATPAGTQSRHKLVDATLQADGATIQANYSNNTPFSQDWYASFGVVAHCKKDNGNGTFSTGYKSSGGYWSIAGNAPTVWNFQRNFVPCPLGYAVTGFIAGGGQNVGLFSPNLNTSDPSPAQMDGLNNQYSFATTSTYKWGDMAAPVFDPKSAETKYRAEVECIKTDGSKVLINAYSAGNEGGIKMPSCEAAGLGHGTGKVTVWATPPGSTTEQNIWSATAPTPTTGKELCAPTRAQPGCKLAVFIDGKECAMGVSQCINWSSLNKDPNWSPRISCQYGPYTLATSSCNPLEQAYEPGGAPATDANTDGNPDTRNDTQPDGSTQPRPSTDPNAPPATGTAPGGFPTTGTNPSVDDGGCSSPTWSWNPVDFVKSPVVCALKDAFVPKMNIQARSDQLRDESQLKVPLSWLSNPMVAPGGGGCPNWTINVGPVHQNVVCGSSFTDALLAARIPLFGLVASAMVWPLLRGIWYACIPVLRVTPGSNK